MKKGFIAIGIFLVVVGIVLAVCSLIIVPFTTTEPIQVPKSEDVLKESFSVPPGHNVYSVILSGGDSLHIDIKVTSGGNRDINFYVMDELNYYKWKARESSSTYISKTRITTVDMDWDVPKDGTYYFVYDNGFSVITQKGVTTLVTKHWTETEYQQVTRYHPLLESQYSYLGISVGVVGVVPIIYGLIARFQPRKVP